MNFLNTERLFSEVLPHISPLTAGEELIENAQRAGAKNIYFTYDNEKTITITNDGESVDNLLNMLVVAETNYSDDKVQHQNPAGMGMILILSAVESISIASLNKELLVDSNLFFTDKEYRDSLNTLEGSAPIVGLSLILNFKTKEKAFGFFDVVNRLTHRHSLKINTRIGNDSTFKEVVPHEDKDIIGKISFGDKCDPRFRNCIITLCEYNVGSYTSSYFFWFGKKIIIPSSTQIKFSIEVVGQNDFFSPSLPNRKSLNNTDKEMRKLYTDVILEFKKEIKAYLKNYRETHGDKKVSSLYEIAHTHGIVSLSDIADFTYWGGIERNRIERMIESNSVIIKSEKFDYLDNIILRVDNEDAYHEIITLSTDAMRTDEIEIINLRDFAPKWYRNIFENHATKDFNIEYKKATPLPGGNFSYMILDDLTINNKEIKLFAFMGEDDPDTVFLTKDFLESDGEAMHTLVGMIDDRFESYSRDDVYYQVREDKETWKRFVEKRVDINLLLHIISQTLGKSNDKDFTIDNISIDHVNKKITINNEFSLKI